MLTPEERAAAKVARIAENQARWARDPRNVNAQREMTIEPAAPEITEPVAEELRSIDQLRAIMQDSSAPIGRRIEAAEHILGFELPAAALARVPDEPVLSGAYLFLKQAANTSKVPEALRFRALKALSTIEAAKPARTDPGAAIEQRHRLLDQINGARRQALIECGVWHRVCISGTDWGLTAADQFDAPAELGQTVADSISAALDRLSSLSRDEIQRRAEARRRALLRIRATNRDDRWGELLTAVAAD